MDRLYQNVALFSTKKGLSHKEAAAQIQSPALAKSRALAYYLDVKQNKTQVEYTAYGTGYQVCLPMDYDFEKSF